MYADSLESLLGLATPADGLGIDLGTWTSDAFFGDQRVTPLNKGHSFSSVVECTSHQWTLSKPHTLPSPERVQLTNCKRLLGQGSHNPNLEGEIDKTPRAEMSETGPIYRVHGKEVLPEEVSGFVLGKIKAAAESQFQQGISSAAIAIPTNCDMKQRIATLNAAEFAGLDRDKVRLVEAPLAIAADCIQSNICRAFEGRVRMLVVYVGSHATNLVLVKWAPDDAKFTAEAVAGDNGFGEIDIDRSVVDFVLEKAGALDYEVDSQRLMAGWQSQKQKLGFGTEVTVEIPRMDRAGKSASVGITLQDYESATRFVYHRMSKLLEEITWISGRIYNKKIPIVLAGAACNMSFPGGIHKLCTELCTPSQDAEICVIRAGGQAVARGAAFIASNIGLQLAPRLPLGIGIQVVTKKGVVRTQLMARGNEVMPVFRYHQTYTQSNNQDEAEITLVQGDSVKPSLNLELGTLCVRNTLPCKRGSVIELSLGVDGAGLVATARTQCGNESTMEITDKDAWMPWEQRRYYAELVQSRLKS